MISMSLSETICVLTAFGGACIPNGSWEHQTFVFQPHCCISCHQNFGVCIQKAVRAQMRAATSLQMQGCGNQHWDTSCFFSFFNFLKTKQWRITQRGYRYGTDNCWQLTSRPDSSSDLISDLASSFSSYVPLSGAVPRAEQLPPALGNCAQRAPCLPGQPRAEDTVPSPCPGAGQTQATSWLWARARQRQAAGTAGGSEDSRMGEQHGARSSAGRMRGTGWLNPCHQGHKHFPEWSRPAKHPQQPLTTRRSNGNCCNWLLPLQGK